jgi:hypothetical protein
MNWLKQRRSGRCDAESSRPAKAGIHAGVIIKPFIRIARSAGFMAQGIDLFPLIKAASSRPGSSPV